MNKTTLKKIIYGLLSIAVLLELGGCATTSHHHRYAMSKDGPPDFDIDVSKIPDAVPKVEPLSKYGNPPSYVANGKRYYVMKSSKGYVEKGIASWYGMKFHKQRTSSGEPYDVAAMTAAHTVLPLPTYAQVTNLQNGKRIIVKVNDRGPFADNRIMDLSYAAAKKLGVTAHGTALVEVKAIDPTNPDEVTQQAPPPEVGHPNLYLQLGAFAQADNAERLAEKVKQWTSSPVVIKTAERNGTTIHRVQIGPLESVDISDELHDKIKAAGLGTPIVAIN